MTTSTEQRSMIPYGRHWIEQEDVATVTAQLTRDYMTRGNAIPEFEKALADYVGVRHVVAVASGTAALHLATLAMGATKKTVGFVPAVTFAATINCLWYCGAQARVVDVDPLTGLIDLASLEHALKKAPWGSDKIIYPVTLQGRVPNLAAVKQIADKYHARVIEDGAHSLGGSYTHAGQTYRSASCTHTHAAILSFHPVKHITTGEGGAIATNDDQLAERLRLLRSHGIIRAPGPQDPPWMYQQIELGYHYRLSDLQAALGGSQLKRQDKWLERRREIARTYQQAFLAAPFAGKIRIALDEPGHAYHLYVVHFASAQIREAAWRFLRSRKIETVVHYKPLYHFPYQAARLKMKPLKGAEAYYSGCLSLPIFPLMTDEEQRYIIETLAEYVGNLS